MKQYLIYLTVFALFSFIQCASESAGSSDSTNQTAKAQQTGNTYTPSTQTALGIVIPATKAKAGESVCVPVAVKDFKGIVSMQHSINWDPKVLTFEKLQGFDLPNLGEANFGLTKTDQGMMGISWYDPSLKGINLDDGNKIYEICFKVVGTSGSSSKIRITNDPVIIEVSNTAEHILGIPTGDGEVVVE
ncbi:MAG: hypothetical protein KDC24_04025 [Saprospiraceae bacterium]|nr:hypothetical protein [Saprospiraceae bacterium]